MGFSVGMYWIVWLHVLYVVSEEDWHFNGDNIAFGKSATQRPGTFVHLGKIRSASLAVDGNTDSRFDFGSCSMTEGESSVNASWTVELGVKRYITGIVIYNRNIVWTRDRLKNFQIYGNEYTLLFDSGDTNIYTKRILKISFDGSRGFSSIRILIPRNRGNEEVDGKYYLSLCEVQIYAAPISKCYADITNGHTEIINDGKKIEDRYTVGTIIEVTCIDGFSLDGYGVLECQFSGEYDRHIPKCVASEQLCLLPSLANGRFINAHSTHFEVGTTLQFTCDEGFSPGWGHDTITCQHNYQWSATPWCHDQLRTCRLPSLANGKFINASSSHITVGATARFTCDKGYTAGSTTNTITCQQNLQWSTTPVCKGSISAVIYGIVGALVAVLVIAALVIGYIVFVKRGERCGRCLE